MEKFISYDKLSKKERKRIDSAKRRSWGGINPVTKAAPDKTKYTRKGKHKPTYEEDI